MRSGLLDIQVSNDNEVSGKLTVTATKYTIEGSGIDVQLIKQTVEITGQFTAKNLDTYVPSTSTQSPKQRNHTLRPAFLGGALSGAALFGYAISALDGQRPSSRRTVTIWPMW